MLQDAFCQFLMENEYCYYSDMEKVLIAAGYPAQNPRGEDWPTDKIEKLFGFGMYTAFKEVMKEQGLIDPWGPFIRRRTYREEKPFTLKYTV